jgi:malate dehydrogenase
VAHKLNVPADQVKNVIIWGNHSNTQYPDISHATVHGQNVQVERTWYEDKFIKTVQTRGAAVLSARKLSSALSAAKAIADHLRSWLNGTADGCCSMAVVSKGDYGIPEGLFYSMPVTCRDGQWSVVDNLKVDDHSRLMMDRTAKELIEERDEALEYLGDC